MNRRDVLKAAFGGAILGRELAAQAKVERATRGMAAPRIKDISVIATAKTPSLKAAIRSRLPPSQQRYCLRTLVSWLRKLD